MDQCLLQDYNIGNNLRRLRKQANMTQQEVVTQLQILGLPISREIYAQIETGRHHVKILVLVGLKLIFKTTFDELLDGAEAHLENLEIDLEVR